MKTTLFLSVAAILLSCSSTNNAEEELTSTQSEAVDMASDVSQKEAEVQKPKNKVLDQQVAVNTTDEVTDPAEACLPSARRQVPKNEAIYEKPLIVPDVEKGEESVAEELESDLIDIEKNTMRLESSNLPNNLDTEQELTLSDEMPAQIATEAWNQLLFAAVTNSGKVNYAKIVAERATLDQYLEANSSGPPEGELAARAYWINQYNAYTIKLIVDKWPVSSIKDLHGGKPWDVKWINIGGEMLSLNQIEFEKLRPGETDARIHFAVNCAAASCPPLHNRLFTAENLEATLDKLTVNFINDTRQNKIDNTPWQLSSIFDWYGGDFRDLELFIMQYARNEVDAAGEIQFMTYDWGLNN